MRIGMGLDIHPFAAGRSLILGGVEIPHDRGLQGHSDADVLTHALADALLGALAEGDLGQHFPSSDASLAGISSLVLLQRVMARVVERGYRIGNVDAVLLAEEPRLAPHLPAIRTSLAGVLGADLAAISVKVTSTDRLGCLGRAEGIAAQAVVLLLPTSPGGVVS